MTATASHALSEGDLERALEAFAGALGGEHVLGPDADRSEYLDPYAFDDPDPHLAIAAVRPSSVDEVRAVVRIAGEHGVPLWTVSRGRNLGYGGAAPRLAGSVVVDLQRMDRILEVSEEYGYALVEPGVRFSDLYEHITERGLRLWPSVPALGWGSVVGNTLERGWGYTPQGEHSAQQCGMEVVLADGDVVRTGMGAIEGSNTWQLFKGGFGPSLDGLFMQSNLGIVTKMGMWMMARPDCYRGCEVKVAREADLAPLVDVLSRLRRRDILQNNAIIGNVVRWAAISGARTRWYDGDGAMPDEVLERIRAELGLGWWDATFGLYGPEELVDARWEIVQRELAAIDGAEVTSRRYTGVDGEGVDAAQVAADGGRATECGVPGLAALTILGFRGEDCGHLGFSPILPPSGEQALRFHELQRRRSAEHGFDVFAGLHVYGRHVCHINLIIFDRHDAAQRANARRAFEALVHDAHELGHSEYRAHVAFMDLVSDQYDWGGHALRRTHERLKDALDADGILSPGKQGVWPASLRPER